MTKGFWVYCPSPMFSSTCTFLYFYILSHMFSFWNTFPPPPPSPRFFSSPLRRFHKPYPQSKTSLNILAVLSGAVFCSDVVLITTPSSSMQFYSFLDLLPSTPTTTGMTLMFLMFRVILLIIIFLLLSLLLLICFMFTRHKNSIIRIST